MKAEIEHTRLLSITLEYSVCVFFFVFLTKGMNREIRKKIPTDYSDG